MSAGARGPSGWSPRDTPRRKIEASDVAYAVARRPRQSWQAIAQQLRVNADDLRRMVEGEAAAVAIASAKPVAGLKPDSGMARMLLAIAEGARSTFALTTSARVTSETCRTYLLRLRSAGLIGDHTTDGWALTSEGRDELASLKRAEEADHG